MGFRRSRGIRRLAAATGAVCVAGSGMLVGATEASAADSLWINVKEYNLTLPTGHSDPAGAKQLHIQVTHQLQGHLPPATVTVDTAGLAGLADVVWPSGCTHTGAVGTCTVNVTDFGPGVPDSADNYLTLGLNAVPGAKEGSHGTVQLKATAPGVDPGEESAEVFVGSGVDLVVHPLTSVTGAKVGSTLTAPIRWANAGDQTAQQTVLTFHTVAGLEFTEHYSNCTYGKPTGAEEDVQVVCTIDTPLAPGHALQLSPDLKVKVTSKAWQTYLSASVLAPGAQADSLRAAAGTPGNGPRLTATPVSAAKVAAKSDDLNQGDNYTEMGVGADNHAHFSAIGAQAKGAEGQTVPVTVGMRNAGPATVIDRSGGDGVDALKVTFPKGTTVTTVPAGCGTDDGGSKAHGPYRCSSNYIQPDGYQRTFTFQVRLDEQLVNARGQAALTNEISDYEHIPVSFPWDDSTDGYTQPIVFNGPAPSTTPDGGTTNAPGTDGQPSSLAATGGGGSTPLIAGTATALLAAGAAGLMVSRRRKTAQR